MEVEWVVDGALKQVPSTVPGAIIKFQTALNKFSGVGSRIALSKSKARRSSSFDQFPATLPFQAEGDDDGMFRALTIAFVRKGSRSSNEGMVEKTGGVSFSAGGAEEGDNWILGSARRRRCWGRSGGGVWGLWVC